MQLFNIPLVSSGRATRNKWSMPDMKVHWSEILWCVIWTLATIQTQLNGSEDFLLEKFTSVSFYTGSRKICPLLVERVSINAFSCESDYVSFIARLCPSFVGTFVFLYYSNINL